MKAVVFQLFFAECYTMTKRVISQRKSTDTALELASFSITEPITPEST